MPFSGSFFFEMRQKLCLSLILDGPRACRTTNMYIFFHVFHMLAYVFSFYGSMPWSVSYTAFYGSKDSFTKQYLFPK
jgi:hypothetical protein